MKFDRDNMNFENIPVELVLEVRLKEKTSQKVLDILQFMLSDSENTLIELPEHPFFESPNWKGMLRDYNNVYLDGETSFVFVRGGGYLSIRTYDKRNADRVIVKFLDWLVPYCRIESDEELKFIGYIRPSHRLHPTLIYFNNKYELFFQELNIATGR